MKRRTLLQSAGALGAAVTAGCVADSQVVGENTTAPGPVGPQLEETDFEVLDVNCGDEKNEARVEFEDDAVVVTGTIDGSDACKTAELADASYDPDADEFGIVVETVEGEDAGACAQCIVEIDYRATFTFDGSLPPRITVRHEGSGGPVDVAAADRFDEGNGEGDDEATE